MTSFCPHCAAALRPGGRFCVACGHRLRQEAPPIAPWQRFAPAFRLWLGLLAIGIGLGGVVHIGGPSPWLGVVGSLATAVVVVVYAARGRRRLYPLLSRSGCGARSWWWPLVVGALLAVFLEGYFWLLARLGVPRFDYLADYRDAGWPLWIGVVAISPMPAIFEEIAFRGVIQQQLRVAMGRSEARIVQAAMFSVLHLSPLVFVSHFVIGVGLGWLRDRTRSLYPGMLLHALWNLRVVWGELDA